MRVVRLLTIPPLNFNTQLIIFINGDKCDRCSYKDKDCGKEFCSIGIKEWLNQEAELTYKDIINEYDDFCDTQWNFGCDDCEYPGENCRTLYCINNFNIIDGKITRRQK